MLSGTGADGRCTSRNLLLSSNHLQSGTQSSIVFGESGPKKCLQASRVKASERVPNPENTEYNRRLGSEGITKNASRSNSETQKGYKE